MAWNVYKVINLRHQQRVPRLIRARSRVSAAAHVASDEISAKLCDTFEAVQLVKDGVEIELVPEIGEPEPC